MFHILDGNKRRHQLRKKIAAEKRALEDAITKRNAVMGETDQLPPPNELLAEENYSWPWECKYIRHVQKRSRIASWERRLAVYLKPRIPVKVHMLKDSEEKLTQFSRNVR